MQIVLDAVEGRLWRVTGENAILNLDRILELSGGTSQKLTDSKLVKPNTYNCKKGG